MQHSLSGWWLTFADPPSHAAGLIQSISMSFNTSFDYGLFTARKDASPERPFADPLWYFKPNTAAAAELKEWW